ncbi:MAG: RNA-binding protein [Rhodoblastus sp.]
MPARDDEESGPVRTCIVTRRERSPDDMIRFVLAPDGTVTPDLKRRLPGRGVWTTASAEIVAQAVKRRAFDRGFKGKAAAPDDLPGLVGRLLEADCLQSLSLANKAGLVTTGFAKVEAAIAAGETIAVLHAVDGGQDGKRKIGQALRRNFAGSAPPEVECLSSGQLDLALGRTNVIHAALRAGPASVALLTRLKRLQAYRPNALQSAMVEASLAEAYLAEPSIAAGASGTD